MRALLLVVVVGCASIGTSLTVWAALQTQAPASCQLMQGGLVSTNACERIVNLAVSDLLDGSRLPSADPKLQLDASQYHESTEAWFADADFFGVATERASRLVREQLGRDGRPMRIEVIRGVEMPTLIFICHESETMTAQLGNDLAMRLANYGVRTR